MLAKAMKANEAKAPPPRNPLAKQLFPSSSPSAPSSDIRDQFKRTTSVNSAPAAVSARTFETNKSHLGNRSLNIVPSGLRPASGGALASLYSKLNSFQEQEDVIDLTASGGPTKANPSFSFPDDFLDDDELDHLDYEIPAAFPGPSSSVAPRQAPEPQQPPSGHVDSSAPWSSSPASHFFPPKRSISSTSTMTTTTLKRESDNDSVSGSAPKKPKKRVLPASFKREESAEIIIQDPGVVKVSSSKKALWDQGASVIQEQQRRQLKTQRQSSRIEDEGLSMDEIRENVHATNAAKTSAIHLSSEQRRVLDLVVNKGQSVFFTGPAGTGKSVLMRAIINDLRKKYAKDPERVAVTASTGLAACNIGGITLHSFSGIGLGKEDAPSLVKKIRRNPKAKNRWLKTKCLIIDEVSMVDGELFDKLSQIGRTIRNNGRPWGGIQLIITGDFFQLPPVPDHGDQKREAKFAFDASTWDTSIDHTIGLTQVFRQRDPEFARMLNEMRLGRISMETERAFKALARPLTFDDGIDLAELFPTRAQVDGSNEKRLRDLPGKAMRFEAQDTGDPQIRDRLLMNVMAPKSLELKLNAQVMLIKNLDESLVNGSLGKVIGFSDERTFSMSTGEYDEKASTDYEKAKMRLKQFGREEQSASDIKFPVVQFMATDGSPRVILCQPEEWKIELPNGELQAKRSQLPLILAWALSIHKAQGQTLERVTVNLGRVFEKGQAYVALSRATSQNGLRVLGFDKSKVMAHPRVVAFYNKLYTVEEAAEKKPSSIADFIANRQGVSQPQRTGVISVEDDEAELASYGY
ncbi:DNA repair and recombination pif1 mitochondrial [Paramyrothecium foliicola]|nr:DNA repair and recombination pif1 mitochondrial [Paramyrothecium foliicola]